MRRLPLVLILFLAFSGLAHAAAWRTFHSSSLGLTVRYPSAWHKTETNLPGEKQIVLGYQGTRSYSLTITLLPIHGSRTVRQLLTRFESYETSTGSGISRGTPWQMTQVGGRPAAVTVTRVSTEGGVGMAQALYVTEAGKRAYEIIAVAYSRHAPSRLAGFPAIYGQILATIRFP